MQHSAVARRVARPALALALVTLAVVVACRDLTRPVGQTDDSWAEQTVLSLQVGSELSVIDGNGSAQRFSASRRADFPVLTGFTGGSPQGPNLSKAGKERRAVIHHFRDKTGKRYSLAFYSPVPGEPPKFIYAFEDGHIRLIDAREYRRHGNGFVRSKSRVTVFDDSGRPSLQVDLKPEGVARAAPTRRDSRMAAFVLAAKDIASVVLPKPLYAEEEGAESCATQIWALTTATIAVGVTAAALTTAIAACPETLGASCLAAWEAGVKVAAAITAFSAAADALKACQDRNDAAVTRQPPSTGGSDHSLPPPDQPNDLYSPVDDTVSEFVGQAIDSGNYWCSNDGNYCVYYAAQ